MDNKPVPVKNHFGLVPLVSSQAFVTTPVIEDIMSISNLLEPMEAEEEQDASMELEEDREEQFHMTAQLYTSNPVMWSGNKKEVHCLSSLYPVIWGFLHQKRCWSWSLFFTIIIL